MMFWRPREECISRRSKWTSGLKMETSSWHFNLDFLETGIQEGLTDPNRIPLLKELAESLTLNHKTRGSIANSSEISGGGVCQAADFRAATFEGGTSDCQT